MYTSLNKQKKSSSLECQNCTSFWRHFSRWDNRTKSEWSLILKTWFLKWSLLFPNFVQSCPPKYLSRFQIGKLKETSHKHHFPHNQFIQSDKFEFGAGGFGLAKITTHTVHNTLQKKTWRNVTWSVFIITCFRKHSWMLTVNWSWFFQNFWLANTALLGKHLSFPHNQVIQSNKFKFDAASVVVFLVGWK